MHSPLSLRIQRDNGDYIITNEIYNKWIQSINESFAHAPFTSKVTAPIELGFYTFATLLPFYYINQKCLV